MVRRLPRCSRLSRYPASTLAAAENGGVLTSPCSHASGLSLRLTEISVCQIRHTRNWPTPLLPHAPVALAGADPARGERGARVGARLEELGGRLHARQEVGVADQVGDAQLREPGLARAEQLARATQLGRASCR